MSGEPAASNRPLGLSSSLGIVISSMVGAGVFTTSGFALGDLGHPVLVLLAWGIAGMIALCGAIGYGELARRFRESGGEYLFLSRTIHPAVGFLAGMVSLLAGFTGAIAFAATALESYSGLSGANAWFPSGSVAIAAVLVATMLHLYHVQVGARVQNGVVLVKFGLLLVFLAMSAWTYPARWPGLQEQWPEASESFSLSKFCLSLVWISLSYCGFNASVYIAGEVRQPERNVPRAMLLGTMLVGVFYLLLNTVFVRAPLAGDIAGQEQVALIAARIVGGYWLAEMIRWTVLISLFTSVSVMIMTGPRVYAKMADDGFLPGCFRFERITPRAAILLQAGLAIVVILISSLEQLLSYLGFTLSLSAALTVASLFWIRAREGSRWTIRLAALVYVVATLLIAILAASRTPVQSAAALCTLLSGLVIYWLIRPRGAR